MENSTRGKKRRANGLVASKLGSLFALVWWGRRASFLHHQSVKVWKTSTKRRKWAKRESHCSFFSTLCKHSCLLAITQESWKILFKCFFAGKVGGLDWFWGHLDAKGISWPSCQWEWLDSARNMALAGLLSHCLLTHNGVGRGYLHLCIFMVGLWNFVSVFLSSVAVLSCSRGWQGTSRAYLQ